MENVVKIYNYSISDGVFCKNLIIEFKINKKNKKTEMTYKL